MRYKLALPLVIAALLLPFAGCSFPEAYPIEKEQNILIAGIDVEGGNIVLTTLVDSVSAGGEAGKEQVKYKLFVSKAKTMFEADSYLHQVMEKRPSWYHTKYVLLGEEAAKSGVSRLLDFFSEDDE
jgi:spore germination protein KC